MAPLVEIHSWFCIVITSHTSYCAFCCSLLKACDQIVSFGTQREINKTEQSSWLLYNFNKDGTLFKNQQVPKYFFIVILHKCY